MAQLSHCHSLSLAPVKYRLVLPSWFYLPGGTFLVSARPGSRGQNPRETVGCVCVNVCWRALNMISATLKKAYEYIHYNTLVVYTIINEL